MHAYYTSESIMDLSVVCGVNAVVFDLNIFFSKYERNVLLKTMRILTASFEWYTVVDSITTSWWCKLINESSEDTKKLTLIA